MGNVRFGVPWVLALALRDALGLGAFVETGTFKGGTALLAALHFERVITLEAHEPRYRKTLAAYGQQSGVSWRFGDSRTDLAPILAEINAPALLWLDAHWLGNASVAHQIGNECPLREELEAVNASQYAADHAILIDDARLFQAPPPYPHDPAQWPTLDEVLLLLSKVPGRYAAEHEDVIVCVPARARAVVERWMGGDADG